MKHRTYSVTLTGVSPLLMHHDDVAWAEVMKRWGNDPQNRTTKIPGDDRTPAYRWLGCLYHDKKHVGIPADNLMTTLREGASKVGTGQRNTTFKKLSQSGLLVDQIQWDIITPAGLVKWADCSALVECDDFSEHEEAVRKLGFELFVKRAAVTSQKHVRVRPRFDKWQASGTITVLEDQITTQVLEQILYYAGRLAGIGDWRPSSPRSPGRFGKFEASVTQV